MKKKKREITEYVANESGRIGYLLLWLMGAPAGLILVLWILLGNNLLAPG